VRASIGLLLLLATPVFADEENEPHRVELPTTLRSVTISASSSRAGKTLDAYAPWKVLDGDANTVWCEGKPDAGTGESLVIAFPEGVKVDEVSLVTGIQESAALFEANLVPSTITLTTDDGRTVEAMDQSLLEGGFDYTGTVTIELGGPAVHKITLTLGTIEPKKGATHTCIGDLKIRSGDDELEPMIGIDKAGLAALPDSLKALVAAFGKCDRAKLADRAQFPLPFDALQAVAPSAENGFVQGVRPARTTYRAATDLAARCAAKDPAAPSVGEQEIDGLVYTARSAGPGALTFRVDTRDGEQDTWRLEWKDRRWKLTAISRIPE
jgi:hypothetical protein